jgi:glycosyltransferase involved in cell wall biosynthesis
VDLADKLAMLLRDAELRKRLGQQGRKAVFEKFSSEVMTSATLGSMRRLLPEIAP